MKPLISTKTHTKRRKPSVRPRDVAEIATRASGGDVPGFDDRTVFAARDDNDDEEDV
jgi:hypothetical protein